ncbi:hypothetical protein EVJ58_g1575 [Rhodofomes roseus]|uniref:HD-associated domain-containing protein n=1 Tax=Rhodofomes roseus TaxID=34475 RepID=A0A4Y9YYS4_9APHY|nr:hypothetical protein EVJ58_g1575 [Rhodofomes roseus]
MRLMDENDDKVEESQTRPTPLLNVRRFKDPIHDFIPFSYEVCAIIDTRKEKPFLFEIVANKRNGLDVDKFDYIARDTHAIDMKVNLSLTRLIHSARVIKDEICYHIKDANQIYELCHTRFSLHKRVYSHKTAKAIEYMLIDALLAAEPHMKFARDIFDPKRYLHLTDDIRIRIEASESPELQSARDILNRIHRRDLYRMVDWKVFPWAFQHDCREIFTPEKIVRAAQAEERMPQVKDEAQYRALIEELNPEHVIVDISMMHYGMKDKNPLDTVSFYSKHKPDNSGKAHPHDVSLLMPAEFGELLLRIYTKEKRFARIVRDAYNLILHDVLTEQGKNDDPLADDDVLTPPHEEERPSTPPRKKGPIARVQSASGCLISDRTPLSQNNFTEVPQYHGAQNTSPSSRTKYKGSGLKRAREDGSRSPPTKKKARP